MSSELKKFSKSKEGCLGSMRSLAIGQIRVQVKELPYVYKELATIDTRLFKKELIMRLITIQNIETHPSSKLSSWATIHFASVHIASGSTAFWQPPRRPPVMRLSPHLMTQNGVPVNVFSLMETCKSYTRLSQMNGWDMEDCLDLTRVLADSSATCLALTELGVALMVGREAWQMKAGTNGKQSDRLGFGDLQLKGYYWMREQLF
ncbi:hypothetical protein TNCV_1004821 [Trichonephila clavipes]|nr:hypothetical protein TNCV_1004821 [Trichonephila clavipes]